MFNPVYGKNAKRSRNVKRTSEPLSAVLIGLIVFLAWAPFQTALFNGQMLEFEKPIFQAAAAACVLLFLWIAKYFKSIRLDDQRDWLIVGVLLLPLSYVISLLGAASHYLAMNMVIVQCIYAIMFIIAVYLLRDKMSNRVIQTTIMTVAYAIVVFGLLHWFGQGKTAGAIVNWFSKTVLNGIYTNAVMVDSNGLRLTSVFQYANTYAAFLMAFLFAAIFYITTSRKWYIQAFHSFMLVPIIVSLLLTLSRGGLVMLPVVFVLLLMFLKPAKQILWILYCAIAGVASLLISKPVTELGLQLNEKFSASGAFKGWGILLGVSVIIGVLGWVIQTYVAPMLDKGLERWSAKKGSSLWIPVASVVLSGLLIFLFIGTSVKNILPQNIAIRLDNINLNQHSVLERFTFYKDAMKVVADYPIFGAGGGAWAALYEQYQNNPYTSRQAHSFFIQYLIEVGIVGFLIFMSCILYIFYKYIRGYIKADEEGRNSHFLYVIIVLSILMHSTLDFNMSYVFLGILVFLGLGGMAAVMDSKPLTKWKIKDTTARGIYSGAVGIGAIVILITSVRYIQASSSALEARKVAQTSKSYEEIKAPLDKDLSIRPSHPDSVLLLSSLYHSVYKQTQDETFYNMSVELLNKALKDEPSNKFMINRLIQGYQLKNEKDKAFDLLMANAKKFKWDIEWHEQIVNQAFDLGYQALGTGDTASKDKYFKSGTEIFEKVQAGIKHLTTLPEGQLQGRAFENTPEMILNTGKMYFITDQPDKAAATLKIGLQEDLSQTANQDIAQWYLASLQKQGQSDEVLMDKLMKVNPNSQQEIQQLAEQQL
ncbi:O-antigen ligase family protein [Paenibacillus sp. N3/727]|uniref:O-antigen ligase family protein n=1 Tax=Paenibacillus sp. N3/727 TaxID=2925845 RepID=UPI001F53549D|nr:O-antigen ligase family protein [Paenibacillus sp. N3/727]UNK18022.1 O-antigen ligase family protein [Paenibacillus sp. N3/727]